MVYGYIRVSSDKQTVENQRFEIQNFCDKEKLKKRDDFWDVVKGIGIISIVAGHISPDSNIIKFLYAYHLVIFYFVSGYFYNEKKYGDKPFENFSQRLKGVWGKYVFYSTLIVLLHNFLTKYNFYKTVKYYNFNDILFRVFHSMILLKKDMLLGSLWFVPTLIFALGMFGSIVYLSRKLTCKIFKTAKSDELLIKKLLIIGFSIFIGIIGGYINLKNITLNYHIETSILVIPIIALAYFTRNNYEKIKRNNNIFLLFAILLISSLFIWYEINIKQIGMIELSDNSIINIPMFYIISISGIIFCISLAKIIYKNSIIKNIIAFLGRYSFSIMALHVSCVKLVDILYSFIINEKNPEIISKFMCSYNNKLWLIYIVVGTTLPAIFAYLINKINNKAKAYISNINVEK